MSVTAVARRPTLRELANLVLPLRRELVEGKWHIVQDSIDGRPLYQYRISAKNLDALERELSNPGCSDAARIVILAPLAAARFSANYAGGPPEWTDCGKEVSRLYRPTDERFKNLMIRSLKHYGITVFENKKQKLLLETIIRESGLTSPMLLPGKPLRVLLDALMARAARGEDVFEAAETLVAADTSLPKRYTKAEHLPQLCADLVVAVDRLRRDAGWSGGSLDSIWGVANWDRTLPFRVPEHIAKEIVGCLLKVAETAAMSAPLSIERFVSRVSGSWRLGARVAFPQSGYELDRPNLPELLIVRYAIDGAPTDEACRIRRQRESQLYQIERAAKDISAKDLSELLAASGRTLSLWIENSDGEPELLDCEGGERLTPELPWIFRSCSNGKCIYLDSGDSRSRAPELLVAALPGTEVTGNAEIVDGSLEVSRFEGAAPYKRELWRVRGIADFRWQDGAARIEAGYSGPDVHLQFSGRAANVHIHGCTGTYIGDPQPRRAGGHFGRCQWRSSGAGQWNAGLVRTKGRVTYRLIDDAGVELARRNVFIFPDSFNRKILHKQVELSLGRDFAVVSPATRVGDKWIIEFGSESEAVVRIDAPGGEISLRFVKPLLTSFHNVATGEQFDQPGHSLSARIIGAMVAESSQHDHILVRRQGSAWNDTHPFPLLNRKLPLSQIKRFLNAFAFDSRGRTHSLSIEFPNQAGLEVKAYRILRQRGYISIPDASEAMSIELVELVPHSDQPPAGVLLQRWDQDRWVIPKLREGCLYLAMDSSGQAAPCLVLGPVLSDRLNSRTFAGCVALAEERERLQCLLEMFKNVSRTPGEGFNSGQIDDCLEWIGRFQNVLTWLDPFLVLASDPLLAAKFLVLATVRDHTKAQLGLRWALDDVPLFWHQLTSHAVAQVAEWANAEFGTESEARVRGLLMHLPMQAALQKFSTNPSQILEAEYGTRRDRWQVRVQQWSDLAQGRVGGRSKRIGDAATALWSSLEAGAARSLLETRCQRVPSSVTEIHRTHLLAPFELAVCAAKNLDIPPLLRDDLIYARYAISPEAFDDAFCAAAILMERMK